MFSNCVTEKGATWSRLLCALVIVLSTGGVALGQMPTDSNLAVCQSALTIPNTSPAQRLKPPAGKLVKPFRMVIAPGSAPPTPGCAAVKFSVAPDGSVKDVIALAEYPPNGGWGEIITKAIAGAAFASEASGGPYGEAIVVGARRARLPAPP